MQMLIRDIVRDTGWLLMHETLNENVKQEKERELQLLDNIKHYMLSQTEPQNYIYQDLTASIVTRIYLI